MTIAATSQNLVSNGGFETFSSLPTNYYQSNKAIGWSNVNGVYIGPPFGSPDYFHNSSFTPPYFGPISPNTGNGQMGFYTYAFSLPNTREYISTQLNTPLIAGQLYQLKFFLTNGDGTGAYTAAVDNFGVHFSNGPLTQANNEVILVTPQIEIAGTIYHNNFWQQYTFTFVANSTFDYITFGNFELDATTAVSGGQSSYYFIDDIELIAVSPIAIQGDTTICLGDSTNLFAISNLTVEWADSLSPNDILSTDTLFTVSPDSTTTYFLYTSADTASFTVNVYHPYLDLGYDTTLCSGDLLILDATTLNATYLWQDGSDNSIYNVAEEGIYWLELTQNNCSVTDSINVLYNPLPFVNLGNDTVLCDQENLILNAATTNASYLWHDSSVDSVFYVDQQGLFWVELRVNNCLAVDSIFIGEKNCEIYLQIPNVFTPNGDNNNDKFIPVKNQGIASMNTTIVNRWGQVVFETENLAIEWDGQDATDGVYFWIIKYVDENGEKSTLNGHVTLLRD